MHTHKTVVGKSIFTVASHHHVLGAWAEIRQRANAPPNLITLDHHSMECRDSFAVASLEYRPAAVRVLLIAEAPPAYDSGRFFYFTDLRQQDTLFLEMMKTLYPLEVGFSGDRFDDGFSTAASRAGVRASIVGTHKGEILGVPPTGEAVEVALHEFHHLENGRITHSLKIHRHEGRSLLFIFGEPPGRFFRSKFLCLNFILRLDGVRVDNRPDQSREALLDLRAT